MFDLERFQKVTSMRSKKSLHMERLKLSQEQWRNPDRS